MKPIRLATAIEGFLMNLDARKKSEHTRTDYNRTLQKFLVHVGNLDVRQINSTHVTAFLAAQPWSAKTVLNYHIGLSAFWTWMIRESYRSNNIKNGIPYLARRFNKNIDDLPH